jgi:integrase/recombinase XerD
MGKNNRFGQAEILGLKDIQKLKRAFLSEAHKLFFAIALNTAERWGAIRSLRVEDIYADPVRRIPKDIVTFRASTRKANPDGSRTTRQVFVNEDLARALRAFAPPISGYLFPSPNNPNAPITFQAVDQFLRAAVERAGLSGRGISTHSTRRTAITRLYEKGIGLMEIKNITGHKSIAALIRYVENNPNRTKAALELLCA